MSSGATDSGPLVVSATTLAGSAEPVIPQENIYGHRQRLDWLRTWLRADRRAVEFGCGTGYMLTRPLRLWGYDVIGVDLDAASIALGRELLEQVGLDPSALSVRRLEDLEPGLDAVIASEVLEHLDDHELEACLDVIKDKLAADGRLLVTVPNGYGWFELESPLWFRTGIGRFFERPSVQGFVQRARGVLTRGYVDAAYPSTVAHSPHRQRFTMRSIRAVLERHGFDVIEARGSVLVCGPFSNLAFTGLRRVMALNRRLGTRFPRLAAGFYLAAKKSTPVES